VQFSKKVAKNSLNRVYRGKTAARERTNVTLLALLSLFIDRFWSYFQVINGNKMRSSGWKKLVFRSGFYVKNLYGNLSWGQFRKKCCRSGWFSGRWVKLSKYLCNENRAFYSHWYPENMSEIGQEIKTGELIMWLLSSPWGLFSPLNLVEWIFCNFFWKLHCDLNFYAIVSILRRSLTDKYKFPPWKKFVDPLARKKVIGS